MRKDLCPFTKKTSDFDAVPNYQNLYKYYTDYGNFLITGWAKKYIEQLNLPNPILLHAIYENLKARDQNYWVLWKTSNHNPVEIKEPHDQDIIQKDVDAFERISIDHASKPDAIMALAGQKLERCGPFFQISFTEEDAFRLKCFGMEELKVWIKCLLDKDFLEGDEAKAHFNTFPNQTMSPGLKFIVSPKGWEKIKSLGMGGTGKKVLIAMAFRNNERRPVIQEMIEKACGELGWEAFTVDKKEYLGRITDEIITSIRESRFIVAEFTKNNHGVYYEAGYADGRSIPVIYAVAESDLSELHFDTSQLNHIVWANPTDLYEKLKNRIKRTIGSTGIDF